jgi:glucose/arabinose dehydrogenase
MRKTLPVWLRIACLLFILPTLAAAQSVALNKIADNLHAPIGITHAADSSGRLFIIQQGGKIAIYDGTQVLPTPFLDVSALVSCCGERGLLGIAFHPQYMSNGFFYINYTDLSGNTVVARYHVSANPNVADAGSRTPLLSIAQPYANHNGGQMRFGRDGYLYIAAGDGGSAGDPENRAQNLATLLGKMLRIDVNGAAPYAIPPTNPFVGRAGARPEIWAYGLRNTWSFSFDRQTGDLIMGDVGQDREEEIDFQPAASRGGENYGWRRMEGVLCFNPSSNCNDGTLKLPVLVYDHGLGCSVTGGYRYRGSTYPGLFGKYFYGDFCSGRLWAATQGSGGTWSTTQLQDTNLSISSFGEDQAGELYLTHYDPVAGALYRIRGTTSSGGEIVVDNAPAGVQDAAGGRTFTGTWCTSQVTGQLGTTSLFSCGSSADTYRFTPAIANAATYDVFVRWTSAPNRSSSVPITVVFGAGSSTKQFNQQTSGGAWVLHGRYNFAAGKAGYVQVSDTNGQASADAIRLLPATGPTSARLTVSKSGGGGGTVTSSPPGISCGPDCMQDYALGTTVSISANADPGSTFTEWGGPCAGNGVCTITMNDAKFLAANFAREVIVDNAPEGVQDAAGGRAFTGTWCTSVMPGPFGPSSLWSCGSGLDTYRFTPNVPASGTYDVYVRWTANGNRSSQVPIAVTHASGTTSKNFNQKTQGSQWVLHGRYNFAAGMAGNVQIGDANGQANADAVRLVSVP